MRLILLLALACVACSQEICLTGNNDPYLHFGTKTAYNFANRQIPNIRPHEVPGCQATAIYLVNRHGSHNPEGDETNELQRLEHFKDNIASNYRNGNFRNTNQRICEADLQLLERWHWNSRHNKTYAGDLTSDGYMQTQQLGKAWRNRYPRLLTDNEYDYVFKFSNDKRSTESFHAFADGLFMPQAEDKQLVTENDEKLLKPYDTCPSWIKDVRDNNDTLIQKNIFESKGEFAEMVTNVSRRLGFNYDIDSIIVRRIYEMCRYNKAWDIIQISPWCSVFTEKDLKRFEYAEDLENYYKYGYGYEMNGQLGCTLIKDMIHFFRKHVENDNVPQQPRSSIQFVDAPMFFMLLSALGAKRDPFPLTGDNYHLNSVQSRQWRSSVMTPFNANLAAVLYKCNLNGNFQVKDRYQVLFLQNEIEMNMHGCKVGLCDWSHINARFGETADKCDLQFCNSATQINGIIAISISLFAFLGMFTL